MGPEDRGRIETETPNRVGIESVEPRPILRTIIDRILKLTELG